MDEASFLALFKEKYTLLKDKELVQKALALAKENLSEQKRLSGDTYFDHNLRVASILLQCNAPLEAIVASLLHSVDKNLEKDFGQDIAKLVILVDSIKQIKTKSASLDPSAIRKILLTTLKDMRAIIVKLAIKLDNIRTIDVFEEKEKQRIAEEVLEVYAPLAYRLGIEKLRFQLEDAAFKVLNPRKYREIANFLEQSRDEREKNSLVVVEECQKALQDRVSLIKIKGRPKHIYSIYRKLQQEKNLREIFDYLGIRIIVSEIKDCYTVLGILHEVFEPLEGRLKDYIATPKPNYYRSLHTTIKLKSNLICEVQIRTEEMEEFAEEGLAAHWKYKGISSEEIFEKKMSWLRALLDLGRDVESKEFLETVSIDLFGDSIYCYTPKGDVKELPKRATILDFAFAVHEDVGSKAVAGRVNGVFVPLKYELSLGDVVEVITHKKQRPRRSWIKIVKSPKARQKIRKSLREYENLPAFHYRLITPDIRKDEGTLIESVDFPQGLCLIAKCCLPLPGEEIVGIVTKRRLISTHRYDCVRALKEEERWIKVGWKKVFNQNIRFFVQAQARSGLLADLLHTIANTRFEVKEAKAKLLSSDLAECSFLVVPKELEQLEELVRRIKKVKGCKKMYFE